MSAIKTERKIDGELEDTISECLYNASFTRFQDHVFI